jgi:HD-like signal output (HDOD) protein
MNMILKSFDRLSFHSEEMSVRDLDLWVSRLSNQEMPIFSRTVSYVTRFSQSDKSSISELAQGILGDTSLTAKILKLANSVYYNPDIVTINTVHWALLRLGYNSLRTLCISSSLVENLLHGQTRKRVIREMVRSFHAAVQAKSFAIARRDSGAEEIFIAALLFRLGYISFYCFGGELVDKLEASMQEPGCSRSRIEKEVLGFNLDQLAAALSREWNLSDLLQISIDRDTRSDSRVHHVLLGHKLVEAVEHGWDKPEVQAIIRTISKFLNKPVDETTMMVHANAEKAIQVGKDYGLGAHASLIPLPEQLESDQKDMRVSSEGFSASKTLPALQREIMQELSTLVHDKQMDISMFLSALLEGILRGVGMDRALLAVLTSDLRSIVGKFGLGWERSDVESFVFPHKTQMPHIFDHVLDVKEALWAKEDKVGGLRQYLTPEVKAAMSASSFFIMPLVIKNRAIGLVCADRYPSGRELDEESFRGFTFFYQLARKALATFA